MCVQIAVKAAAVVSVGRATTIGLPSSVAATASPTVIEDSATIPVLAPPVDPEVAPGAVDAAGPAPPPESLLAPHAASRPRPAAAPAPVVMIVRRETVERMGSSDMSAKPFVS